MEGQIVVVRVYGGLGNQMFQYAFGRALSVRHNARLLLDASPLFDVTRRKNLTPRTYSLPSVFDITPQLTMLSRLERWVKVPYVSTAINKYYPALMGTIGQWKYVKEKKPFVFDSEAAAISGSSYFDGYWQSERYFKSQEDMIRRDFTFRHPLPEASRMLAQDIDSHTSVCLHVRRGDYVHNPAVRALLGVVTDAYYNTALSLVKDKLGKNFRIFVFSDDVDWCAANMNIDVEHVFVDDSYAGENAEGHLQLMTLCKHFVIPNSTFAWWAAWLSKEKNKVVVAPKVWTTDTSVGAMDILPPEWISI